MPSPGDLFVATINSIRIRFEAPNEENVIIGEVFVNKKTILEYIKPVYGVSGNRYSFYWIPTERAYCMMRPHQVTPVTLKSNA